MPFLNNLTWVSKKHADFKDWLLIAQLMAKGLHLTEVGLSCILAIKSRMNFGRLSTNKDNPKNIELPLPDFDITALQNKYELTAEGLIKEVETSLVNNYHQC